MNEREHAVLVLVVEDEPQMLRFLRVVLPTHGFQLIEATTGAQALNEAATRSPDLVLLDLGLPDFDGVEVTRRVREWSSVPIIVLSARGTVRDKVAALEAGADDYLAKPFAIAELLARMTVAVRHNPRAGGAVGASFQVADLVVDLAGRTVLLGGSEVHLTRSEYKMLAILVRHAGMLVTHRQLLREVWGPNAVDRAQDVRAGMANLRHKLEVDPARPRYFLTEPGVGYRLVVPSP